MGDKVKWECKFCAVGPCEVSGKMEPKVCLVYGGASRWKKENTKLKDALEKLEKGQHFFGPEETVFGGSYIEIREAEKIFIEALREE